MKKIVALTAVLTMLGSSMSYAGSVSGNTVNKTVLAKEIVDNQSVILDPDNFSAFTFTPSVDVTTLSVSLIFTGAKASNLIQQYATDNLSICGTDNITKYKYKQASSDNKTLIFEQVAGANGLAANLGYRIGTDNGSYSGVSCTGSNVMAALIVDKGSSGVTMTLANSTNTESMSKTLYTVKQVTKGDVINKASYFIDYNNDFKKLYNNGAVVTADNITLKFNIDDNNSIDDDANVYGKNMTFTYGIELKNNAGLDNVTVKGALCNYSYKSQDAVHLYSCEDNITGFYDNNSVAMLNVSGNKVIDEKTFTVKNVKAKLQGGGTEYELISSKDAGEWKYRGVSVYVPLVGSDPASGRETYIKLQSKDTNPSAGQVKGIVLAKDGTTAVVDLNKIKAGEPLVITGAEVMKKVADQGKEVDGKNGFALILNVAVADGNLFGYANMVDPYGAKRIPLIKDKGIE